MKAAALIALAAAMVGPAEAGPSVRTIRHVRIIHVRPIAGRATARAGHARVDLLADSTALPPGGAATLGVRFTLDPGWHIYWRNPGESGGAPTIAWNAPAGVTIGEVEWPAPQKFSVPGDTTYGYQNSAILIAKAAAAAGATGEIALRPSVEYQICKDVCVKETARPSLTLTIGSASPSAAAATLADAAKRLPAPMPADWKAAVASSSDELTLTIATGQREPAATFLPYQPNLIDDSAPQRSDPRSDGIALHLRTHKGAAVPAAVDGLLLRSGQRAVEIRAQMQ